MLSGSAAAAIEKRCEEKNLNKGYWKEEAFRGQSAVWLRIYGKMAVGPSEGLVLYYLF